MSTVCRVCLTSGGGNVTLCSLEDVRLQDVYKKLTDTQFHSEDGRPRVVCSLCFKNLLKCWTLSEMARRSENILSNLLFKGLEATLETIENLNLGTNLHLMQTIDLDNESPKNSSAIIIKEEPISVKEEVQVDELVTIIIKEEPISVKEEVTIEVDELVDSESADTLISEECIKSQLIFEEDSNNGHYLTENSNEIDIVQLNTEKLNSDQEERRNHKTKKIDTGVKRYACGVCDKRFYQKCKLVLHMRVHTGVKPHACSICDKQFNVKSNLVRHMRVHTTGVKPHACSICDKQFYQKNDLVRHMGTHTEVKPQKSNLVMHMKVHTGVKPHACSICDKQFNEKSNLVRHMRVHTTGVKPHACSICDKQFYQKNDLVRHMRIHTGVKPYTCSTCDKQFNENSNLVRHMRVHAGVKPYACGICDKQFIQKSTFARHMVIHTGINTYDCGICDKQFIQKSHLVMHIRIHSGEKP